MAVKTYGIPEKAKKPSLLKIGGTKAVFYRGKNTYSTGSSAEQKILDARVKAGRLEVVKAGE